LVPTFQQGKELYLIESVFYIYCIVMTRHISLHYHRITCYNSFIMAAKKTSRKTTTKTKKATKKTNAKRVPVRMKKTSVVSTLKKSHPRNFMSDDVWNSILVVFASLAGVFFIATQFGHGGYLGEWVKDTSTYLVGPGYWLLFSGLFFLLAYSFLQDLDRDFHPMKWIGSTLFLVSGLGAIDLTLVKGGMVGGFLSQLQGPIGFWMALLLMIGFFFISLALILDAVPFFSHRDEYDEEGGEEGVVKKKITTKKDRDALSDVESERIAKATKQATLEEQSTEKADKTPKKQVIAIGRKTKDMESSSEAEQMENSINAKIKETFAKSQNGEKPGNNPTNTVLPPMSLLAKDKGKPEVGDIKSSANTIKRTLSNFGIEVEMGEVEVGPTVTRYAFKPAEGVKLARIAGLKDDLALALAAKTIRMETPIPGKSLVGIEIPNRNSTMVGFGSLLQSAAFLSDKFTLPLAVGKTIAGEPAFIDMAKAPHILVAGTTGAGKSVTVNALICSMLYKHGPDMLKFIMVDPKRVELTMYNGIPHLLTPVITDAKSVILSLKWAVKEMERRLEVLEKNRVRDIGSYHENVLHKYTPTGEEGEVSPEKMPYICIVIDELADIMQAYPKELEAGIVTLAQKSRAAGIHLVLSTQRPSVNVITGVIKANLPTRIALQVASAIDSRTILDMGGAEQLLGKGDMLYMTGNMSKPIRVQCAYLSEDEVGKVVTWIKKQYRNEVPEEIDLSTKAVSDANVMFAGSLGDDGEEDDLYEDAKLAVIEAGKASTSYLQRKLRVGYSRAARLMDILEENGVIGPADGSKPREILQQRSQEDSSSDEELLS